MSQQHARSGDIDDGDALLGGNSFEEVATVRHASCDTRSFATRVARVEDVDGNILLNRRQHGCRVQYFRAEVSELGGFVEADEFDATRFGTEVGIGGHHAVDVSPDFDALGTQLSAYDCGGVIGTAATDGRGVSAFGCADKAANNRDATLANQRLNLGL